MASLGSPTDLILVAASRYQAMTALRWCRRVAIELRAGVTCQRLHAQAQKRADSSTDEIAGR